MRIATVLSQRALALRRPAAHGGLVHDVVVVQRREVGQLDHDGRRDDAGRLGIAELGGQQHEQRPEPLAAGGDAGARAASVDEGVVAARPPGAAPPRPAPRTRRRAASSAGSADVGPRRAGSPLTGAVP